MKTFLISDTHFGHANMLNFKRADGSPLRVFKDVVHMNEVMINNWNNVVGPDDKVYHLGDVGFKNATYLASTLSRLNGTKVLIKGNHDTQKLNLYQRFFKDVRAYHILDKLLLAHVPIHPRSLERWKGQVHGHLHDWDLGDPKYLNVSVERINYTPVDFEWVREQFK
jgi:calcineurin-like phosphoesterase family protein